MPVSSTRPPHQWRGRARDLHKLASATDDGPVKTAMSIVESEYERLARNSTRWTAGARVTRKDSAERGTIVDADDARTLKVSWDGGRTSYFRRDRPANVKLMDEPPA